MRIVLAFILKESISLKKIEKNRKKTMAPRGAHISAQGSNFKIRLGSS